MQDVAQETASIEGVAETRMTMDFALFKGASIRFQDTETASTQAASLVDTHQGIKNGMSCSLSFFLLPPRKACVC